MTINENLFENYRTFILEQSRYSDALTTAAALFAMKYIDDETVLDLALESLSNRDLDELKQLFKNCTQDNMYKKSVKLDGC